MRRKSAASGSAVSIGDSIIDIAFNGLNQPLYNQAFVRFRPPAIIVAIMIFVAGMPVAGTKYGGVPYRGQRRGEAGTRRIAPL